jgi:hypothetical protein
MAVPICELVIDLGCKDAEIWETALCGDCPVDNLTNAKSKTTCLKEFSDSAVDGRSRASFPTLIMGESIFWDDLTNFVDCVLCHDIHRSH